MTEHTCITCNTLKSIDNFQKRSANKFGYSNQCKECINSRNKNYYEATKEVHLLRNKQYNELNKEKVALQKKEHRLKNIEHYRTVKRNYVKNRKNTDPLYKMKENLRRRTRKAFSVSKWNKGSATNVLLGCEYKDLFTHIENKFTEGMSWDNQGRWHIDHIKPLSLATTKDELVELCHYTNLQPLWAEDNIKKSNSF